MAQRLAPPALPETPPGRYRILFSLFHTGYLRHYGDAIRLLAARGHTLHLVFGRLDKDTGDELLLRRLLEDCPGVTASLPPERSLLDGWHRIAWFVRGTADFARYADPRYADAPALRARIGAHLRERIAAQRVDPITRRLLNRVVDRLDGRSDAAVARRWIGRMALLDDAIPPNRRVTRLVRDFRPDAVLASPVVEVGSPQVEYLKSARALGVPTGVAVASWDNLTNKGLIRFLPDRVLVWNETQVRELEELHRIPRDRAVVTGAQRYDEWFERVPTRSRPELLRRVGLDPDRPFLLYVCSSPFIAPAEVPFVRRWLTALRSAGDERLRGIGVVVRPHPQNSAQWAQVDLSELGNATIWPREGRMPDEGDDRADYFDSLSHCAAVVGINTSALVEAAVVGRSTYTVLAPEFAGTQEGTLHFHYLRADRGGVLHVARDLDEHLAQLAAGLDAPGDDLERARSFVASFVRPYGLDVAATPLVAATIEELAQLEPAPAPRRALRLLLRPPLSLAAALLAGAGAAGFLGRGDRPKASRGEIRPASLQE